MKNVLKKKLNKKGFTLAELLIVVAIIAVLVAVMIPIFSASTEKAEEAVVKANLRSVYAEAAVEYLDKGSVTTTTATIENVTYTVTTNATSGEPESVTSSNAKKNFTYDGTKYTAAS